MKKSFKNLLSGICDVPANVTAFKVETIKPLEQQKSIPPRRMSPMLRKELQEQIRTLLDLKVIRRVHGIRRMVSGVVMVRKKKGWRKAVDYRTLNNLTLKDAFPLPNYHEILENLGGNMFYASLDLSQGFLQVPMHEDSVHLTAFVTPEGVFEYVRMPFGLSNAPLHFQRVMHEVLGELVGQ